MKPNPSVTYLKYIRYGCLIVVALKETFGLPPLLLLVVNQKFGLICAMILQYTSDMSPNWFGDDSIIGDIAVSCYYYGDFIFGA
jgi:hypothetical protein